MLAMNELLHRCVAASPGPAPSLASCLSKSIPWIFDLNRVAPIGNVKSHWLSLSLTASFQIPSVPKSSHFRKYFQLDQQDDGALPGKPLRQTRMIHPCRRAAY